MRLNQVMVRARDLDASIGFYRMLGLRLIVRSEDYARFECPDGESTFSLHLEPEPSGVSETLIYFEDDDLDGLVVRLKAKGLTFEADPVDQSWLWREAYLRDPAGNRVCLFYAGRNRRYPPWRLSEAESGS
jgi:catechol 2,3-dioxygenase-like lactoylglutathione lyase family enzyme